MLTNEQQNQLKDILRLIPPDEQAAFLDMLTHDLRGLTVASCAASQNTHGANSFCTAGQCTVPEMWPNGSKLALGRVAHRVDYGDPRGGCRDDGFRGIKPTARLETRSLNLWNLIAIQICVIGVIGLLLAVLHGIECGIWAAAYLWLGALDSP